MNGDMMEDDSHLKYYLRHLTDYQIAVEIPLRMNLIDVRLVDDFSLQIIINLNKKDLMLVLRNYKSIDRPFRSFKSSLCEEVSSPESCPTENPSDSNSKIPPYNHYRALDINEPGKPYADIHQKPQVMTCDTIDYENYQKSHYLSVPCSEDFSQFLINCYERVISHYTDEHLKSFYDPKISRLAKQISTHDFDAIYHDNKCFNLLPMVLEKTLDYHRKISFYHKLDNHLGTHIENNLIDKKIKI